MNESLPYAITVGPGSSEANHTGDWRTKLPRYVKRLPPCAHTCPAGEDVQRWLELAGQDRHEEAWHVIMEDNPFPAIHGRVCYHTCEDECNRKNIDAAVSIHAVERFLGDLAIRRAWNVPVPAATGKRVLVVGSGPSGLTCGYHLARLGHHVVIVEAGARVGGMMRYGIPQYRLPRDILDAEVDRIRRMGVEIICGHKVKDARLAMEEGRFDAAFLAVGAHLGKRVEIPSADAKRMIDAVELLRQVGGSGDSGSRPKLGRTVAVYGGGNTAMDAARTARRLGAERTIIIYRRDEAHMPAHKSELEEALAEGVEMHWLRTVAAVDEDGQIRVEIMSLDDHGKPVPTGQYETLSADTLILAVGQETDTSLVRHIEGVHIRRDGIVQVDSNMMTGYPGLFAGGDMVPGDRTVTHAVGHGKKAARCIHHYLTGQTVGRPIPTDIATFDKLNAWYYPHARKAEQGHIPASKRLAGFGEVLHGLEPEEATYEAHRCLSCGNCMGCDNCYSVCPDSAITKIASGQYVINEDFCKGCGMCVQECPAGAIEMGANPLAAAKA